MENIYNYKTAITPAQIKDADSKTGIVTGYFSAFGNKDSDGDIITPGAFKRTIEERGPGSNQPRIKHLLNHNVNSPIGKILTLKEDAHGLYYESQTGSHTIGKEFIKMVESGLITEHSIGYRVIKSEKAEGEAGATKLTELQLWEGSSLTAWGANQFTPLTGIKTESKAAYVETIIKKQKAIESFCRNSDISDDTIELLLLANKQLTQTIIDLSNETTKPGAESILPDNKEKAQLIDELITINSLFKLFDYGTQRERPLKFN